MKRALIIGAEGQDGRLLGDLLKSRGYVLAEIGRGRTCLKGDEVTAVDVLNPSSITDFIRAFGPNELYYLAALHQSSEEERESNTARLLQASMLVHFDGWVNCLQAVCDWSRQTRCFYAASTPQTEETSMRPVCAYGISKAAGVNCCRAYRKEHGVFAAAGILYNHESWLRSPRFVSQKIVRAAQRYKAGMQKTLVLGDLAASTDWGYAPDYVEAMTRILALSDPDDFIIATGIPHTTAEFVAAAFEPNGTDWRTCVQEDVSILSKPSRNLLGDSTKLRNCTGWRPSVSFEQMVKILLSKSQLPREDV
jgi:GDPmannose 4,6-dehydratase